MSWAAEEFKGINLGDKRLNQRAILLAERLAEKPTASIPGACGGSSGNPSGVSLSGSGRDGLERYHGPTLGVL
jgi:transposase-like protein